jgi:hypothetical protein
MARETIGPGDLVTVDLEGKLGQPASVSTGRFARYGRAGDHETK